MGRSAFVSLSTIREPGGGGGSVTATDRLIERRTIVPCYLSKAEWSVTSRTVRRFPEHFSEANNSEIQLYKSHHDISLLEEIHSIYKFPPLPTTRFPVELWGSFTFHVCTIFLFYRINNDFTFDDAASKTFGCTVRSFDPR